MADLRVGTAFDAHRLVAGRPLVPGRRRDPVGRAGWTGTPTPTSSATCSATPRSAPLALGDIGRLFPGTPEWRDAASIDLLARAFEQRRGCRLAAGERRLHGRAAGRRRSRRTSTRCARGWPSRCARPPTASRSGARRPTASVSRPRRGRRGAGGRAARALGLGAEDRAIRAASSASRPAAGRRRASSRQPSSIAYARSSRGRARRRVPRCTAERPARSRSRRSRAGSRAHQVASPRRTDPRRRAGDGSALCLFPRAGRAAQISGLAGVVRRRRGRAERHASGCGSGCRR